MLDKPGLSLSYQFDLISVMDDFNNEITKIRLYRTLRIPEDGEVHPSPNDFGAFPARTSQDAKLPRYH